MFENYALRGILSVMGAFLISLAVGQMYLWGIITIYATSYFRIVMQDSALTEDQTDLVFPLTLLGQAIAMPFVIRYAKKVASGMTCFVAGIVMSTCMYLSSLSPDFNTFAVIFGLGNGLVIGVIYILPIGHCYQFFPRNRTAVSILIIAASGIGTLIFSLIATGCMNPSNLTLAEAGVDLYYGKQIAMLFPDYLRILSGVTLALVCGGGLLLFEFPTGLQANMRREIQAVEKKDNMANLMDLEFVLESDEVKQSHKNPFGNMNYEMGFMEGGYDQSSKANQAGKVYGERGDYQFWPSISKPQAYQPPNQIDQTNQQSKDSIDKEPEFVNECPRTSDGPKQSIFWVLFAVVALGTNFGLMVSVNYKTFVKGSQHDDKFLTMVGFVGAIACGLSRYMWGWMLERSTFKFLYIVLSVINAILAFSIPYVGSYQQIYFVYVVLAYICYGGHLGMFPAVTGQIFGIRYGPQIYGILFYAFPLSNFLQYLFVNYIEQGYWVIFKISGVMSICALLIVKRMELKYDWSARIREHNERKRLLAR